MQRITLLLVVEEEAGWLAPSLEAAAGAVDEIVVVDVGAPPEAAAAIRAAGAARVERFFSGQADAYNAGLARASGEWILALAEGERLAPGAAGALRAAAQADADGWLLPCRGPEPGDEAVFRPRLLRRSPDLRWEGAARAAPREWLAAPGRRLRDLPRAAVERAAVPRSARQRERDQALLEREAHASPRAASGWLGLASERERAGLEGEAWEAVERAWALLQADPAARGEGVAAVTLRAGLQIQRGDLTDALHSLATAAGWGLLHPNMLLQQGAALVQLADRLPGPGPRRQALQQAVRGLTYAPTLAGRRFTDDVLPGATGWAAHLLLGRAKLQLDDLPGAEAALRAALAARPGDVEASLGLAEAVLERDPAEALSLVAPLRREAGLDGHLLAAAAYEAGWREAEMTGALVDALEHLPGGLLWPHRRELLDELVGLLVLLQGRPRPGRGAMGAAGALLAGQIPGIELRFPVERGSALERRLTRVVAHYRRVGTPIELAMLADPAAEALFPGIRRLLGGGPRVSG